MTPDEIASSVAERPLKPLEHILTGRTLEAVTAIEASARMIPLEDLTILANIVDRLKPVRSYEVGLLSGSSAVTIMAAKPAGAGVLHIACDPYQTSLYDGRALKVISDLGFADRFRFAEEAAHASMPKVLAEDGQVQDLVFLDGNHKFDYTLVEWFFADKMIRVGGVVVFDDCHYPMVQAVANFVEANCPYRFVRFNDRTWAAIKMAQDKRSWMDFTPFAVPFEDHHRRLLDAARATKAAKRTSTDQG